MVSILVGMTDWCWKIFVVIEQLAISQYSKSILLIICSRALKDLSPGCDKNDDKAKNENREFFIKRSC
jgi:hypothetical protein